MWNKKLSCRREAAWCFMSLNISLSHSEMDHSIDHIYTSFYWRCIVTTALSCIISQIKRHTGRKLRFSYPACIRRPHQRSHSQYVFQDFCFGGVLEKLGCMLSASMSEANKAYTEVKRPSVAPLPRPTTAVLSSITFLETTTACIDNKLIFFT